MCVLWWCVCVLGGGGLWCQLWYRQGVREVEGGVEIIPLVGKAEGEEGNLDGLWYKMTEICPCVMLKLLFVKLDFKLNFFFREEFFFFALCAKLMKCSFLNCSVSDSLRMENHVWSKKLLCCKCWESDWCWKLYMFWQNNSYSSLIHVLRLFFLIIMNIVLYCKHSWTCSWFPLQGLSSWFFPHEFGLGSLNLNKPS